MPDPLENYIKPEFPKTEFTENAVITRIEYVGPTDTIVPALLAPGAVWGDYPGQIKTATHEPTEDVGTSHAVVTVEQSIDNTDIEPGTLTAVSYEIRWVTIERSMYEHPDFIIGGGGDYQLTNGDIYDLQKWQAPENEKALRDAYSYNENGYDTELSANAKMFARGIELGLETFEDKAPVAIRISEYVGGPPPETDAGLKQDPMVSFPNLPSGFEWRKETADSTRAAGATKWTLTEEWQGAKKILFDRLQVFWTPPT